MPEKLIAYNQLCKAGYNRPINRTHVNNIKRNFCPDMVQPAIVSFRDGKYWIVDHQHQTQAIYERNGSDPNTRIRCDVRKGLTYEQEAELYYRLNTGSKPLGFNDKLAGLIESKDPKALEFRFTVESCGYVIGGNTGDSLNAIHTAWKIFNKPDGADTLTKVLTITKASWPSNNKGVHTHIIDGLVMFLERHGDEYKQDRIMLLVTENCNLNCSYCYEHRKNRKNMPYETAISIIDAHLKDATSDKPIIIEVFGGEAFANFDLIRKIDAYVERTYGDLNVYYETTTNGTLVHGDIQEWLTQRKEKFLISVSVDGTRDMHNQNRVFVSGKGSFDSIDLDFFAKTWPGCPAKMTISEQTLPNMTAGIMYLESLGFKCDATLSVGMEWDYEKNQAILIGELNKLIEYYTANPEQQLCTMLNLDLREIFAPFDENFRFCGAGVAMACYDADGKRYPCQGFAPVSIGEAAKTYVDFNPDKISAHCKKTNVYAQRPAYVKGGRHDTGLVAINVC